MWPCPGRLNCIHCFEEKLLSSVLDTLNTIVLLPTQSSNHPFSNTPANTVTPTTQLLLESWVYRSLSELVLGEGGAQPGWFASPSQGTNTTKMVNPPCILPWLTWLITVKDFPLFRTTDWSFKKTCQIKVKGKQQVVKSYDNVWLQLCWQSFNVFSISFPFSFCYFYIAIFDLSLNKIEFRLGKFDLNLISFFQYLFHFSWLSLLNQTYFAAHLPLSFL